MKLKVWLGVAVIVLSSLAATAQDQAKKGTPSAEQQAAMEAMMKAATPGEAHKKLSAMVGAFDTKVSMWMQPGAPPQVSTGISTNTWILGGRFVQQQFSGTFMGKPFSGIGYTGYDNLKEQYIGAWMDTGSTSMMVSTGKQEDSNTYTFSSTMEDPVTKKSMDVKEKVTVVDKNQHMMEMWAPAPDGTMFKMMEITYTRKK